MRQVASGKAFEYGMAFVLADVLGCSLVANSSLTVARRYYDTFPEHERNHILLASKKMATFLLENDNRFGAGSFRIFLQPDLTGRSGDVRDIVMKDRRDNEIGLSLKNRHEAIKHSRLSEKLILGKSG